MENENDKLTVGKINNAVKEVQDFLNSYLFVFYKFQIKKKLDSKYFDVKITDKAIDGITNIAMLDIILKSFKFSEIYWIESSNGWLIFNFRTKSD